MSRHILILLFFGQITVLCGQNLESVDSIVLNYPSSFKSPKILAQRIDKDFDTDMEKTRATFMWITEHIAYSFEEQEPTRTIYRRYVNDLKLSQDMGKRVLKTKKAICSGYSQLFQNIMIELNIASRVVTGNAKADVEDIGRALSSNHAWNIVTINHKEYLIDTTWGAGSWNGEFIKERSDFYFCSPPELFALSHFPDNHNDTLLPKRISKREFSYLPKYYTPLIEVVTIKKPVGGMLERKTNKPVYKFVLETNLEEDWLSYNLGGLKVNPKITKTEKGYSFPVDLRKNEKARTLIIFLGGQALVGYRIK